MTIQSWDTSLIGVDPAGHARSVLVVPGADTIVDAPALDELRRWGWAVTVVNPDTDPVTLEALALSTTSRCSRTSGAPVPPDAP